MADAHRATKKKAPRRGKGGKKQKEVLFDDEEDEVISNDPESEDGDTVPRREPRSFTKITRYVEDLKKVDGRWVPYDKRIDELIELPPHEPTILPVVDLSLMRTKESMQSFTDLEVIAFIRHAPVLQLIKQYASSWITKETERNFHAMQRTFLERDRPWNELVEAIAMQAGASREIQHHQGEMLVAMSSNVATFVRVNNDGWFNLFSNSSKLALEPYKFTIRLFLSVWLDIKINRHGFFGTLIDSKLAEGLRPEQREVYEKWYLTDDSRYQRAPIPPELPLVPAQTFPHVAIETLKRRITAAEQRRAEHLTALAGENATIAELKNELAALTGGEAGGEA